MSEQATNGLDYEADLEIRLGAMTKRAEAAEQLLAEYKANHFTVDESEMVKRLKQGKKLYLTDDIWIRFQDGKIALETHNSQEFMAERNALHTITVGAAMMHILKEQKMERE